MGRRRDSRAAVRRHRRRALLFMVIDRLSRGDLTRLGRVFRIARRCRRGRPAFPPRRAPRKHPRARRVCCYDERLRLLPSYLQQLEMESNGKGVTLDGKPVGRPTAAITWGGVGTDAQHAVFQLLHQGTHLVPLEFIGMIEAGDTLAPDHHKALLTNMFAQGAALMKGKANPDQPARAYPGDRPSTTLLLDDLDARTLGALIAYHEHRVFVNGVLLNINSFDQFGAALGKAMAKAAQKGGEDFDVSTTDLLKRAFGGCPLPHTKEKHG